MRQGQSGRPRLRRRVCFNPKVNYFKPRNAPMRFLSVVEINREELEALRLKNILGLNQNQCAARMKTSQSTFQRILSSACKKITEALVEGKAIKIIKDD